MHEIDRETRRLIDPLSDEEQAALDSMIERDMKRRLQENWSKRRAPAEQSVEAERRSEGPKLKR